MHAYTVEARYARSLQPGATRTHCRDDRACLGLALEFGCVPLPLRNTLGVRFAGLLAIHLQGARVRSGAMHYPFNLGSGVFGAGSEFLLNFVCSTEQRYHSSINRD